MSGNLSIINFLLEHGTNMQIKYKEHYCVVHVKEDMEDMNIL